MKVNLPPDRCHPLKKRPPLSFQCVVFGEYNAGTGRAYPAGVPRIGI